MKILGRILLFIAVIGMIMAIGGFSDTMLLFKGDTVNLTDPLSRFDDRALVQGEIDFVYGPFCTLETSTTRYGITTSTHETDFFIVGNIESGQGFAVLSTGNTEMREKLTDAADKWVDWLTTEEDIPEPEINISFRGKLWEQYDDSQYDTYYRDAKDDLANIGIGDDEYAEFRIIEGEVSVVSLVLFFGGIALILLSIVIVVIIIVQSRRRAKREELW